MWFSSKENHRKKCFLALHVARIQRLAILFKYYVYHTLCSNKNVYVILCWQNQKLTKILVIFDIVPYKNRRRCGLVSKKTTGRSVFWLCMNGCHLLLKDGWPAIIIGSVHFTIANFSFARQFGLTVNLIRLLRCIQTKHENINNI